MKSIHHRIMHKRYLVSACTLIGLGTASSFFWFVAGRATGQAAVGTALTYAQPESGYNPMPSSHASQSSQFAIGTNVQVSKARADQPHQEVILAADPTNPRHLLAGSMLCYLPDQTNKVIVYESMDAGATWRLSLEPARSTPGLGYMSDPTVAFGPEGEAYFGCNKALPNEFYALTTDIVYRRLPGHNWSSPTAIAADLSMDRPYLVVDKTRGTFRGRVYCDNGTQSDNLPGTGNTLQLTGFYTSLNKGATFSLPTIRNLQPGSSLADVNPGNSVVLSDGVVVLPYHVIARDRRNDVPSKPNAFLYVIRSLDGGASIERIPPLTDDPKPGEHRVPRQFVTAFRNETSNRHGYHSGIPCLAADASALTSKDRLYIVWDDDKEDGFHTLFSSSKDKGYTWSAPIQIDDTPRNGAGKSRVEAFMPEVAVNNSGVIGVSWYDTRDMPAGQEGWNLRFSASLDGGKTWLPSQRVSDASTLFTEATQRRTPHKEGYAPEGAYYLGDTAGLATDTNGVFHPLWIDNRTGIRQVWTATVTVEDRK